MDFQIYETAENSEILLERSSNSKSSWGLNDSMENDEYFNWTNSLKIDEKFEEDLKTPRKRKLPADENAPKTKTSNGFKFSKNTSEENGDAQKNQTKKTNQNGKQYFYTDFC